MDHFPEEGRLDPFAVYTTADDNVIQTFQLDVSNLRGRAVRIGSVLHDILEPHAYPAPVAHLVAETITLAVLLSSMLKYTGVFTLQARGDGPVKMLVADITSEGVVRGCASFDPERVEHARQPLAVLVDQEGSQNHLAQYLGKGYIAFTVDQGPDMKDRYQGIVELQGASLVDCVQHYFAQSEQIMTGIKMAVGKRDGFWRAGGIMLQKMPDAGGIAPAGKSDLEEDDWRRAMILMDSCSEDELLSAELHSNILLARLFHEEDVRVYKPLAVSKGCRCSKERVDSVISTLSDDDLEYMAMDDVISAKCEFCSQEYVYSLSALMKDRKNQSQTV
jgi:molecular chaperone Hsp33